MTTANTQIVGVPEPASAAGAVHAATVAPTLAEHEETFLGMGPPAIVALSMVVVILLMVWKGVPRIIARGLDSKIAGIRRQLDEAQSLREEAERLRGEARARAAAAHQDAQAIVAHAHHEAEQIVAKAKADAADLIGRRTRMAEDKIEAEQRAAVAEVRAHAADAAVAAAAKLIRERQDSAADRPLVDRMIGAIGAR